MRRTTLLVSSSLLLLLLILGGIVDSMIQQPDMSDQDIRYSFVEGQRLLNGKNPYSRVLSGDMVNNDKYATYFPAFYELSYLSEKAGLTTLDSWLAFWRIVFIVFGLAIATLLYWALARRGLPWIGLFAAAFWLFNRWTMGLLQVVNLDFVPIFFLLLSLELFPRNKWLSLALFGLSLAVKQIAIFVTPLYFVWLWRTSDGHPLRDVLVGGALIASFPFITSLPFLVWDARGFVYSMLFSATRAATAEKFLAPALSAVTGRSTGFDRLLMLSLMLLLYIFAWRMPSVKYVSALMIMLTFVDFNPVLFDQYILWTVPLGLLLFCDVHDLLAARPASPPPSLATT